MLCIFKLNVLKFLCQRKQGYYLIFSAERKGPPCFKHYLAYCTSVKIEFYLLHEKVQTGEEDNISQIPLDERHTFGVSSIAASV